VTSSSSSSPREHLYRASIAIRQFLADNDSDQLFFQHRYVAWAREQERNAQLRIALDIIHRNTPPATSSRPTNHD
jgi:hypothetical protein